MRKTLRSSWLPGIPVISKSRIAPIKPRPLECSVILSLVLVLIKQMPQCRDFIKMKYIEKRWAGIQACDENFDALEAVPSFQGC